MIDKKHWYDGWFYDKLIAPNQDKMFKTIAAMLPVGCNIADVGCGTGRLSFQLADKCGKVVGIDLSSKNINTANLKLKETRLENVSFFHSDINDFNPGDVKFDYAIITYVIHEIPRERRGETLRSLKRIADKIIIGDYAIPQQNGLWKYLNEAVEFAAGRDHYANFKSFKLNGGLTSLAEKNHFKILKEIKNNPSTSHIMMLK